MTETATRIVQRLQNAGFSAYWVGGCVRDYLLGREPGDYDIVTSALPDQIENLFSRTIPVGRKFGVIIVLENNHEFQVATFRAEADYQDGRHPAYVVFGDAVADARRRDFTVNGLFYDPVERKLHDWVGGEADLRAKIICVSCARFDLLPNLISTSNPKPSPPLKPPRRKFMSSAPSASATNSSNSSARLMLRAASNFSAKAVCSRKFSRKSPPRSPAINLPIFTLKEQSSITCS
jgi:hypothetical protein